MSAGFTPGLMAKRFVRLIRVRELPIIGEVLVHVGQELSAIDSVARALLPGEMRVVRVAEALGLPAVDVAKTLLVKEGDKVEAGELIAKHSGLFGLFVSQVKAPISGIVELVSKTTGHVSLRGNPSPITVEAYVSGVVKEVMPQRGVKVETCGTCIQGIFGVGGERIGKIKLLNIPADKALSDADLPTELKNSIVVGGCRPSPKAIEVAVERGAVGMIVGSVDDEALKTYLGYDLGIALTGDENVPMTLIATEGFGKIPISQKVLNLLKEVDGSLASVNGATQVRAGALRPEIIVPRNDIAEDNSLEIQTSSELKVGGRVRVIRTPYFGRSGEITELPHQPTEIETGALVRVARVKLDGSDASVTVPRANLEISA